MHVSVRMGVGVHGCTLMLAEETKSLTGSSSSSKVFQETPRFQTSQMHQTQWALPVCDAAVLVRKVGR